jgi:hypothetical protein
MAHRLTVELDEREMRKVQAAAHARGLDPQHMTAKQLVLALGATDSTAVPLQAGAGQRAEAPVAHAATAADTPADALRAKRLAAVMGMHGIWKDDPTKPQDGVEYQREVRAEWR